MSQLNPERLLADCDEAQAAAITATDAPLLILASAGSGKTRVLTRRIAWRILRGDAEATHCLALTFTRKAAGELRERVANLGLGAALTAGTFHAVALAQLRRRALDLNTTPPALLESKARLLGALVSAGRTGRAPSDAREFLALAAGEIEWAKARLIGPDGYEAAAVAADRASERERPRIAELFARYEREKRRRRLVDFEDLLSELCRAMSRDAAFAAAQRWRFRHFFVDEYQDVNPAQVALLQAWLGDRTDLCAVGDPHQAIYAWNGADPHAIASFADHFPGARLRRLDRNYRSTPQVVAIASSVLATAATGQGSEREDGPLPSVTAYANDEEEAAAVAAALRSIHRRGRRWSQCAVLARTNAQLSVLEHALGAAGVPVRSGAATALFEWPAVREALAQLEPRAQGAAFCAWLDDVELDATAPSPAHEDTDDEREPPASPARAELEELVALGRDYLLYDPAPSGDGFLAFARQMLRSEAPTRAYDGVELLSFHRAKGLEWPVVFVTGLEDGFVPIARARTKDALEEEERLLYVALSRASDELHCSWSRTRKFPGRSVAREPSPYLHAIDSVRTRLRTSAQSSPKLAKQAIAESRAALDRLRSQEPSSRK